MMHQAHYLPVSGGFGNCVPSTAPSSVLPGPWVVHGGDDSGALSLVISLNVQRRDLTAAQRAIVAARAMETMPDRRGGDRKSDQKGKTSPSGRARDVVANEFKVSDKAVQQAKALLSDAPDLVQQVESCTLSLAAAYEELQDRRPEMSDRAIAEHVGGHGVPG